MRVSSSGLIYAVIVGAWAAYLVPMWLRRQDELNEARPTERFSTAIRLLSGKAAMERRYAKEAERREADVAEVASDDDDADGNDPEDATGEAVDFRAFAEPRTMVHEAPDAADRRSPGRSPADRKAARRETRPTPAAERRPAEGRKPADGRTPAGRKAAERSKRAQVLARRRRTTMLLFLCFSVGAVVAAVGGVAFLWAPAAPAALLSAYIAHLRTTERRRFHVTMDRRRAEQAAAHLREQRGRTGAQEAPPAEPEPTRVHTEPAHAAHPAHPGPVSEAHRPSSQVPGPERSPAADRRALVEQTDHAEWVDQERGRVREQPEGEGWEPVPVPLPTYVNAPVAPRTARGVDLDTPDAWSSARSTTASSAGSGATSGAAADADQAAAQPPSSRARRDRTPLFDQMADKDRPRAANE
ncbi:hypothetical protein RM572_11740 [Streptomyces sp. DSM 42041]|uniref:Uncharacterized protein n=1 Tax=Streptomyces hazeniae TaxID=3075538 RepID=A0ABU2NR37_9ACTN|nr:hypothetical protein [Streptomyces sp. DSM 42041]MDT0379440.1 hypothetical protein [Streptomyces sp. DSM 42041]